MLNSIKQVLMVDNCSRIVLKKVLGSHYVHFMEYGRQHPFICCIIVLSTGTVLLTAKMLITDLQHPGGANNAPMGPFLLMPLTTTSLWLNDLT